MGRAKRIWYLSPMWAAKVQASLPVRAVSPEPSLLAHTRSESRGTFRQKARSLAPLNGWACAVKICHDGMLEDTNSLDGAHMMDTVYTSSQYNDVKRIYMCGHKVTHLPECTLFRYLFFPWIFVTWHQGRMEPTVPSVNLLLGINVHFFSACNWQLPFLN